MGSHVTYHCLPGVSLDRARGFCVDHYRRRGCDVVDDHARANGKYAWICGSASRSGGEGCLLRCDVRGGVDFTWLGELIANDECPTELIGRQEEGEPWELELRVGGVSRAMFSACSDRSLENNPGESYVNGQAFLNAVEDAGIGRLLKGADRYFVDWGVRMESGVRSYSLAGLAYEGDLAQYGESAQICDLFERVGYPEPVVPVVGYR